MNFEINTVTLLKGIKSASDIALKNVFKYDFKEVFKDAEMLTMVASSDNLTIKAYGGTASIFVTLNEEHGYIPSKIDTVTVNAAEMMTGLKSFTPAGKLLVSSNGEKLKVSLKSDQEIFMEIPTVSCIINCPIVPKDFQKKCIVDRHYFIKGVTSVAYAMAKEDKMITYQCILFQVDRSGMWLIAGSGGRFAGKNINIPNSKIANKETRIIIPKSNIGNLTRIFKDSDDPNMIIRTVESNASERVCEQIVLENDNITLALYGTENFGKYPDLIAAVNYDYPYSILTRMNDWKKVAEAITATRQSHISNIHNTDVIADLTRGYFEIQPRTKMKINRKVAFELGAYVVANVEDKNHKPWFRCNSNYLEEITKRGDKKGIAVINFEDQTLLDEIPNDQPKIMKPVLVRYPKKTNKDGSTEKDFIFFSVSVK
jgi:hypothetical protein